MFLHCFLRDDKKAKKISNSMGYGLYNYDECNDNLPSDKVVER